MIIQPHVRKILYMWKKLKFPTHPIAAHDAHNHLQHTPPPPLRGVVRKQQM